MSAYDRRQQLRQREMDEDALLKTLYGMQDVDMQTIAAHVRTYTLSDTEKAILERAENDHRSEPRLFMLMFALWLAPHLNLAEGALPRRFEPFQQALPNLCMDMLEGRVVSLQQFVRQAAAEYVMGPKDTT